MKSRSKLKIGIAALIVLGVTGVSLISHSQYALRLFPSFVAIPHFFKGNTTAVAEQVNANFKSVADALNGSFIRENSTETLGIYGHIRTLKPASGAEPSLDTAASSCGEYSTIEGTDTAGVVKVMGKDTHTCTIKFATAFNTPPVCTVSSNWSYRESPIAATVTKESLTVHSTKQYLLGSGGEEINYICLGR